MAKYLHPIILCSLLFTCQVAMAKWVEVEGTAVITNSGTGAARQAAINDAIRQAAIQAGALVQSLSEIIDNVLVSDSAKIRASGKVKDVTIIDEWIDNDEDLYFVVIRADVIENGEAHSRQQGMQYRRKIAMTQFSVVDRRQIHDMPNIEIAVAQEIMRRLELDHAFLTQDATQYSLQQSFAPYEGLGQTQRDLIVQLANTLGVQFIISGKLLDMGVTKHPLFIQLRHVELEVSVWDGISGALVTQRRLNGSVWEEKLFDFPTSIPVMNDKFFASPIGQETNRVLQGLVEQIAADIKTLPFMARVIKTKDNTVYIDAGTISAIKVGDILTGYQLATEAEFNPLGSQFLGYQETQGSIIVVKRVQPHFSVAEIESTNNTLHPGDVVRVAW